MEEGYPGNLDVKVTYTLTNNDELKVRYEAETDMRTVVNLTQHSYFNLSADLSRDILGHQITINADSFLPVDTTLIPTGELRDVEGTPFDFRESKRVGDDINEPDRQLTFGNGYDHCWVLNNKNEECELYPLELNYCPNCHNCQLSVSVDPKKMFSNYLYTSSTSQSFRKHFEDAAKHYAKEFKLSPKKSYIIDIGSNDGVAPVSYTHLTLPTKRIV